MAQTPSNSSFANLGPADHAKILEWLIHHNLAEVKDLLAKPRPDGFSINTSIMSISRYKQKFFADYLCELHECDPRTRRPSPKTPAELRAETLTALRHRLFNASLNSGVDPSKLRALCSAMEKIRAESVNDACDLKEAF